MKFIYDLPDPVRAELVELLNINNAWETLAGDHLQLKQIEISEFNCILGCPRKGIFSKIFDWLNTALSMCYGIRSPENDFENYRPITPILQALFVLM